MKCVNATWELRNLGVETIEIDVENNPPPIGKLLIWLKIFATNIMQNMLSLNQVRVTPLK